MSRPNPIEGIEPSEVFQASCQYRRQWINGIAMNYHHLDLCSLLIFLETYIGFPSM